MYAEARMPGLPAIAWASRPASPPAPAEVPGAQPVAESLIGPDGCMDLVRIDGRIHVVGADTRARLYRDAPGATVTGVRFDPGVLPQLLGVPAHVLVDAQVDLTEVIPTGVLARILATAPGVAAGAADGSGAPTTLAAALCAHHGRLDPMPVRAARAIATGRDITGVADDLGYSTRQLRRHGRDWFGYGPKHLSRILRYRSAAGHLDAGSSRADAAARAGYSDASHLWRDERDLMTPA